MALEMFFPLSEISLSESKIRFLMLGTRSSLRLLKNGVRSSPFSLVLGRISKPLPGISGVKFPLQSLESGAVLRLKLLKLGRD